MEGTQEAVRARPIGSPWHHVSRGLYVFKHESKSGNAQAQRLFGAIQVQKKAGVESPRAFTGYTIVAPDPGTLPEGITFIDGFV